MKYVRIMMLLVFSVLIVGVVISFYQLGNMQIRQTKDYAEMIVDENDILDFEAFLSPPEKYPQLLQIDLNMRKRVAEYMQKNNYKLKSGKQKFVRNNPNFDELVNNGFLFERLYVIQ